MRSRRSTAPSFPTRSVGAADEARPRGVAVVEAAVTGGAQAAAEGRTTFLLGGDPADLELLDPLLGACGEVRIQAGPLGTGARAAASRLLPGGPRIMSAEPVAPSPIDPARIERGAQVFDAVYGGVMSAPPPGCSSSRT